MLVSLDNPVVIKDGEFHFMPFQEIEDITFMLKRVFVGYRCRKGILNIMDDVKDYPNKVDVIQTRPAFKTFSVVEQTNDKYWNWEEGKKGNEDFLPAVRAIFGDLNSK